MLCLLHHSFFFGLTAKLFNTYYRMLNFQHSISSCVVLLFSCFHSTAEEKSLMLLSLCLTSWTSNHNFVSLYGYHILKLNMKNQHLKHINIDRRHHHTHKQQKKKKSGTIDRKLEANHTIRI